MMMMQKQAAFAVQAGAKTLPHRAGYVTRAQGLGGQGRPNALTTDCHRKPGLQIWALMPDTGLRIRQFCQ